MVTTGTQVYGTCSLNVVQAGERGCKRNSVQKRCRFGRMNAQQLKTVRIKYHDPKGWEVALAMAENRLV